MVDTPPQAPPKRRGIRRPGYFGCRHILARLHRFQDLVRHDQRWGNEIGFAPPIEKLLPKNTKPVDRATEIDRQIYKLVPLVARDLRRANLPTEVEWPHTRYDPAKQRMVEEPADRSYHLIGDYFRLPRDGYASAFKEVMGALDMGIGVYEELKRRAFWELFNPLAWIAHVLHAPLWVAERAGLVDPEEPQSWLLTSYLWVVRAMFLVLFVLVLRKLGLGDLFGTIIAALK